MYFTNCKTLEELKKAYRIAAMANHPDRGGDPEIMKQINTEYDIMFDRLKNIHNAKAEPEQQTTETPEEFRDIVMKLIILQGIEIELCGSWIWISGKTYENREALKACGCRFSHNKKMWYWRHEEDSSAYHGKPISMDDIREKYGSDKIGLKFRPALQGT